MNLCPSFQHWVNFPVNRLNPTTRRPVDQKKTLYTKSIITWKPKSPSLAGERQNQSYLIQKEAIYFPGYGTKIPNHNTQIIYPVKYLLIALTNCPLKSNS